MTDTVEVSADMVDACVETGTRFAAATGVLARHLADVLAICGDAGAYPWGAREKLAAAKAAVRDLERMGMGEWVGKHAPTRGKR